MLNLQIKQVNLSKAYIPEAGCIKCVSNTAPLIEILRISSWNCADIFFNFKTLKLFNELMKFTFDAHAQLNYSAFNRSINQAGQSSKHDVLETGT